MMKDVRMNKYTHTRKKKKKRKKKTGALSLSPSQLIRARLIKLLWDFLHGITMCCTFVRFQVLHVAFLVK